MKQSDNYSTDYISQGYYQNLVETRMECNRLSTELELEADNDKEERFKKYMSFLAKELVPKYQRRSDKEKPEKLEDLDHLELTKLSVNDCRRLLTDFNDLMEKLGIVSKANTEYELKPKGAVNKNE